MRTMGILRRATDECECVGIGRSAAAAAVTAAAASSKQASSVENSRNIVVVELKVVVVPRS